MKFSDIIGQDEAKALLHRQRSERRIPHAQLFAGSEGSGALPLAIAFAQHLLCTSPQAEEACGVCPSCIKLLKLAHPDLHFTFPVVGAGDTRQKTSDAHIKKWRELLAETTYFSYADWLKQLGVANQQALIYAVESDEIARKLSLKSSEGGYKISIIWLPEKIHVVGANKLLKLLEEPPEKTLFFLVSERPDTLLQTILSRTQRIQLKPIEAHAMTQALQERNGLDETNAMHIARLAGGNYVKALGILHLNEDAKLFFTSFVELMRLGYARKIKELRAWSEKTATLGRERQKSFLAYCARQLRENFIYNYKEPSLVYLTEAETDFSSKFAPFINRRNIAAFMTELDDAARDIEHNVNPKMVFFDLALKTIVLLKHG